MATENEGKTEPFLSKGKARGCGSCPHRTQLRFTHDTSHARSSSTVHRPQTRTASEQGLIVLYHGPNSPTPCPSPAVMLFTPPLKALPRGAAHGRALRAWRALQAPARPAPRALLRHKAREPPTYPPHAQAQIACGVQPPGRLRPAALLCLAASHRRAA